MADECSQCGATVELGLAYCPQCGAQVGTLFSEAAGPQVESHRARYRRAVAEQTARYQAIERARDRASNSVFLALSSFFCPGLGFLLGCISIYYGISAASTLKAYNIEEGRGAALAGIIIGAMGLLAQIFYTIYAVKMGIPFLG
jgi:hypothetical protein